MIEPTRPIMNFFRPDDNVVRCGIEGVLWEERHRLRENADCVLRLFERKNGWYVLKLSTIWAD
jgi:hypothetical protein